MIELAVDAISPFQYLKSWDHSFTNHHRYSPQTPYEWNSQSRSPWNAYNEPEENVTQPWDFALDRQIALVEWRNISLGEYLCANGGACIAPDTCACDHGWIGFDCRTPVCEAGYYESDQDYFVDSVKAFNELEVFELFLGNNTYRLDPYEGEGRGYSNPIFFLEVEKFVNHSHVERMNITKGDTAYLTLGGDKQGGYSCSIRSVTEWEHYKPPFMFEHPNYFSRYMDKVFQQDGHVYSNWENMTWDPVHVKSMKKSFNSNELGLKGRGNIEFIYTDKGYEKGGQWSLSGSEWKKGVCIVEFKRVCSNQKQAIDLESRQNVVTSNILVQDTDKVSLCQLRLSFVILSIEHVLLQAFRFRSTYDAKKTYSRGQWDQSNGECVDHVIRGCYNNGTCVAPNTCVCSEGWTGSDCTIPLCSQICQHHGNCTLPNTCTCERGWRGYDCSIPICAQNCVHGTCVAPDTCKCDQWESEWRDGRSNGGSPIFQQPNGDPQMTGWTYV